MILESTALQKEKKEKTVAFETSPHTQEANTTQSGQGKKRSIFSALQRIDCPGRRLSIKKPCFHFLPSSSLLGIPVALNAPT